MKIYRLSKNMIVRDTDLWSHKFYLEEVWENISSNRLSLSKGVTPIVTKSLDMPRAIFIMDGHHRIIEGMLNGEKKFEVEWNKDYPYIDAGIGNEIPADAVRVVDFISEKQKSPIDIQERMR